MLKGVPSILSPELLKVLMEMGHGDEIVIADGNFPAASHTNRLLRSDGHNVPDLLKAVLSLFPLDTYSDQPVALMAVVPGDAVETPIWKTYEQIIDEHIPPSFAYMERFAFYERAKQAYAIVATSEKALYANIILRKGVIKE
ncbi:L-fucose mutarotase [Paenibacillus sp. SYP-B3998]|uniref:L-fucose mutarotase n=1 Tax=Paenibacillus sp. SYP-B3998 TaxID=2678564 RepID=A0A6G3ZSN7_9BACL|nr:L-fucose mutarotase [Paenibacillus sp. SYP-B3998]NEW05070.1 L-fucose mutarotase [Paenibacillus sp. SYP-B3998]